MDEKEIQIRSIVLMEEVSKRLNAVEVKVDSLYNEKMHTMDKDLGITKDKVNRMEKIIYGTVAVIIAQVVGIVFLYIQKK